MVSPVRAHLRSPAFPRRCTRGRTTERFRLFAVALTMLVGVVACSGPSYRYTPGPYETWSSASERSAARTARLDFEAGRYDEALLRLQSLRATAKDNLPLSFLRQEVELALLEAGLSAWELHAPKADEDAISTLSDHYADLAEVHGTAADWIRAARVNPDRKAARAMLERALEIDPDCPWGLYGLAFLAFRERDFARARELVKRTLEQHGAHPPTVRLQATLLANAGDTAAAIRALEAWMDYAIDDPLVSLRAIAEARIDLACLFVLEDEPEDALDVLEDVDPEQLEDGARLELVRAVAYDETGRPDLAIESARRASELDRDGLLGLMQQAVIWRNAPGGAESERAAWKELLVRAEVARAKEGETMDFTSELLRLYAAARMGRLDRLAE